VQLLRDIELSLILLTGLRYLFREDGPANVVNRSVYANYTPQELPVSDLTHVLYAFADIKEDTGEV
jgi:hypothetical protein